MDSDEKIVAYHEDKEVVEDYIYNAIRSNKLCNDDLRLVKIKDKLITKNRNLDDLYLVRYGSTYIQTGYLLYLQLVSNDAANENKYLIDLLLRTLEIYDLSDKDVKTITKAVKVINKIIETEDSYTPSIKELKHYKDWYDEQQNSYYLN